VTREGEIVRVADRIAYVNHDVDDALRAGVISWSDLPKGPLKVLGDRMSVRIDVMVRDMILTSRERGEISPSEEVYAALMELRTLFAHYLHRPEERAKSDPDPVTETVDFVAGMTDRYALAIYKRLFLPRSDTIFK
jgi:dGTPase